jgi:predicted PurR-regulated permease PerM
LSSWANLGDNVKELTVATRRWLDAGPPAPPAWLAKVPGLGPSAVEQWKNLAADSSKLLETAKRFIEPVSGWLLGVGLALGRGLLQLALSILVAFFLFRDGGKAAERLTTAVDRIAGERGRHLLAVAGNTVRGVVYGILGTALVQAVMAGIGFLIAGVPGAGGSGRGGGGVGGAGTGEGGGGLPDLGSTGVAGPFGRGGPGNGPAGLAGTVAELGHPAVGA